jgi:cellulose synthase/poly-beta-1,6-N-acetylglucosamine synthase-like glycosyltransferase
MLEPAMFLGLGAVAFWLYVRCPRLRPNSILRAAVHVAASFLAFALLPAALGRLLPLLPSHVLQREVVLALLLHLFTYVLLSWIWLVARVLHDLFGGTPRGGHPVSGES